MDPTELAQSILDHVLRDGYQPVKPRVIAKKLKVPEAEVQDFKRILKRLVKQGKLAYGEKHLVRPPAGTGTATAGDNHNNKTAAAEPASDRVTGIFRRMQQGYGFVRPTGTAASLGKTADIFIPADNAGDASSGDRVMVRLKGRAERGKQGPAGVIVEVLERETHQFVGTYFERGGAAYVQVDGTLFVRPISVGDPGAKNAVPDDKVVFEMVRFPTHTHGGDGVINEVLGSRGQPGVDTLSIIREFNLPEEFAEDALDEARAEADRFDESIPEGRLDLTAETVITIDPVDARDFDDAISLVRLENGHWRLGVHIADVSHFVRPRTALDREARDRATSTYLPDRVLPMLPEIISNSLASLQPDHVRYSKTAFIEFTHEGAQVAVDLHTSAIQSKRRFTYEEVDEFLADRQPWREKLSAEVFTLLERMHELAMILRARRFQRGSLELSMQEVKIDLDRHGRVVGAHRVENTESHQIIEEFMLAANEAVAQKLAEAEHHFLRRVHAAPDPRKLKALTEFIAELGFKTESLENRFELQKLLDKVAGRPEAPAVNYAVLRSLQRAVYSPEDEGHYALASDCYCHFTSPIRRYPDLTIHRLVDVLLAQKKPKDDYDVLALLGEHCSNRERRAEAAERELTKVKLLNYLTERVGEELDAVITGVEEFGLFAQGISLPAEGLIHISSLSDDFYHYERKSHTLTGRRSGNAFRLGDRVRVVVARVDVDRRALDFRIVRRDGRADGEAPKTDKGRKSTRRPAGKSATKDGPRRRAGKTARRKPKG